MKRLSIFALALALTGATWVESRAQEAPAPTEDVIVDENGDGLDDGKVRRHRRGFGRRGGKGRKAGAGLTQEQKTELKAAVSELKESGATPEEVRAAIDEFRADSGLLTREQRAEREGVVQAHGGLLLCAGPAGANKKPTVKSGLGCRCK